jgi:hypothetical protein
VKVGDLVRFRGHTIYGCNKVAVYLGDCPLRRVDGVVVNNFSVLYVGKSVPNLCDGSMKGWLEVISESR